MSKETFSKQEVVKLLVNNNNALMKIIDSSKEFVIVGDNVICNRIGFFGGRTELSRYSFDYIIIEAEMNSI